MSANKKYFSCLLMTTLLMCGFSQKLISDDRGKPREQKKFYLDGHAYKNKDGSITVTLLNNSPDKNDYLISQGELVFASCGKEGAIRVITGQIISVIGDPQFVKVSPTAPKTRLLSVFQCYSLKFSIPKESQESQIDFVEITVSLCKLPITTKSIILDRHTVRVPFDP